jgi:hypothetical protein
MRTFNVSGTVVHFQDAGPVLTWQTGGGGGAQPGDPVGGQSRAVWAGMNSLYVHTAFMATEHTNTPIWVHRFGLAAPGGGNAIQLRAVFGFGNEWSNPVPTGGGVGPIPTTGVPDGSWVGGSNVDVVTLVSDNFFGQDAATPSTNHFLGWNYLTEYTRIIDAWESNAPNPERIYAFYTGWQRLGAFGQPGTITAPQRAAYIANGLGFFNTWQQSVLSALRAARPALASRIVIHDINNALMLTLRDTVVSTIPMADLFVDDAPHGTATWYFLAGLVQYIELFNEKPPANFSFEPGWGVHATVTANYQALVDFIWGVLRP